jgi:hypothetical protein
MVPFIGLKEEPEVDPKLAKGFPEFNFSIDPGMAFRAVNGAVITCILNT